MTNLVKQKKKKVVYTQCYELIGEMINAVQLPRGVLNFGGRSFGSAHSLHVILATRVFPVVDVVSGAHVVVGVDYCQDHLRGEGGRGGREGE